MSINVVNEKLMEANAIKERIRLAIISKDIDVPEGTPFSSYPDKVAAIAGLLQERTITPTADGVTALPEDGFDGFSVVFIPAEPNLVPEFISEGATIFGVAGIAKTISLDVAELFAGNLTDIALNIPSVRDYGMYKYTALKNVSMPITESIGSYAFQGCTQLSTAEFLALKTLGTYAFQSCTALKKFVASKDLTVLNNYAFSDCSNLNEIDLSGITEIKDYALNNCKKVENIGDLKCAKIGSYGCYYLASSASAGFNYTPSNAATLGGYALRYAKILSLTGVMEALGDYAIANCSTLTSMDIKINGPVNQYALSENRYVADFRIDPDSNITALNNNAFYYLGYNRADAANNRHIYDLRKSTFPSIGQRAFAYLKYADVYLPETVETINTYAIANSQYINVYFTSATPPTISATNWTSSTTNYKLFIPYNHAHAYKNATNWTSLSSNLVGYAMPGTFIAGEALPTYNGEGMALTWYSDVNKTNVITTVPDGSPMLYCDSGARVAYVVSVTQDENTTVTIVDSEGIAYNEYPAFVPVGRGITVDIVAREDWNNATFVAGVSVALPYTIDTLTADTVIRSSSWQGDIDPDFENCTWANIQNAVKSGVAASYFAVGSTRKIETTDGQVITLRVANNSGDLYERADGSGHTGFVMEFVELWNTNYYMNSSSTNTGGWDASYMRNTVMPIILSKLPEDLKAVIAPVKTKSCYSGGDGKIVDSVDTLFLPAEREIFASRSYSRTEEWNVLTRWQWYASNDTANARIKYKGSSAAWWWLRSPYSGGSYNFTNVSSNGYSNYYIAYGTGGVAPGFCI